MVEPSHKKKILVVEDNHDNRELLVKILRETQHEIFEAKDGKEAVEKAIFEQPDLIFMDLSLPIINGFEVTRLLREEQGMDDTKIIALSGSTIDIGSNVKKEFGWDGYLLKPVTIRNLLKTVNQQLT